MRGGALDFYEPPKAKPYFMHRGFVLDADPGPGIAFTGWTGCTASGVTCTTPDRKQFLSDPPGPGIDVTATFVDVAPPSVTLAAPGPGPFRETVTVNGHESDNVGVTRREFYVDDAKVTRDGSRGSSTRTAGWAR